MALSDKNIIITPNIGQSADPKIVFSGADANTSAQNITLQVYPTNSGTLSFEGSSGQLFSINNNLTGSIFSVNDISGIPSIEVLDNGLLKLNEYSGNVAIGFSSDPGYKLGINGSLSANSLVLASGKQTIGYQSALDSSAKLETSGGNISINTYVNNSFTYDLRFRKTRSTIPGTYSLIQNGDTQGSINWFGDDGTQFLNTARIDVIATAATGANNIQSALSFSTLNSNSTGTTEKLRLNPTSIEFKPGSITSNFYAGNTGTNPIINFDSNDFLSYDRSNNIYNYYIGSANVCSLSSTSATFTGEVISTAPNQFRSVQGNFGSFIRNDGSNVYLLQTANGSPYGTFNSFRPFAWNLNNGEVNIASNGNTAWFGGSVNIGDNKTINVGTGNDLYLVHDGTNSSITNQTGNFSITNSSLTGNLLLQANSSFGANFELTPTAAYLDSNTSFLRSQDGLTQYLTVSSAGATVVTGSFNGSGAGLTTLNASNVSSGTIATARLGSGTANANTVLYGDNTWKYIRPDLASLSGVETLTNKTITAFKETKTSLSANNVDLSLGNYYSKTISGTTTLTVSNVAAANSVSSFILDLTNGGSAVVTWWSGVKWAAGTAPTLTASGRDILGFFTYDGGTIWNGLVLAKDIK